VPCADFCDIKTIASAVICGVQNFGSLKDMDNISGDDPIEV